ncbi:MAG: hemerythrin domain-containing protein [Mycobacteriales bacterium]
MDNDVENPVDLLAVSSEPHDRALAALEDRVGPLAAVAWCSAHLAATDRVLYAAGKRRLPGGRGRVNALRAVDRSLQQALCRLDRRLTGDVHVADVPIATLADEVRDRLRQHAEAERELVEALSTALTAPEREKLAHRLARAMATAPSRPHPHNRHTPLSTLLCWADALVDRVRDAMDNRVDPTGRPARVVRPPGRWGCYLMGTPYPTDAVAADRPGASRGAADRPSSTPDREGGSSAA